MNRTVHAKRERKARNLLFAVLGLALAGFAWIAIAWLTLQLQATDTFFWASNHIRSADDRKENDLVIVTF